MRRYRQGPPYLGDTPDAPFVLAVDLGARKVGAALVTADGWVEQTWLLEQPRWDAQRMASQIAEVFYDCPPGTVVVFEWPVKRRHDRNKHAAIAELQRVGYQLRRLLGDNVVEQFEPSEWGGTIEKGMRHRRVFEGLCEADQEAWWALTHDERDAACIGLFALGYINTAAVWLRTVED